MAEAFWTIVNSNVAPEEGELADALDFMNNPKAVTIGQIIANSNMNPIGTWMGDRKNRRAIPHKMERCGYVPLRNPDAKDMQWVINRARQTVYVRRELSVREQHEAVRALIEAETHTR
jgi:hypothetical protein